MKIDWNLIFKRLVGAGIWGLALGVGAYDLSVGLGVLGAFLGSAIGYLVGPLLAESKFRSGILVLIGVILFPVLKWLCAIPVNSQLAASLLSPDFAYKFSDGSTLFFSCLLLVGILHALTIRYGWFMAVEIGIIIVAMISPLTGHRDGFISRPYFFVDPLWSAGYDPMPFFIAVGAFITIAVLFLSVGRFNKRNTFADLIILLLITVIVAVFLPMNKLNQLVPEQQKMGLQGQPKEQGAPPKPEGSDKDKDKDKDQNQNKDQNQDKDKDKDQNQDENKDKDKSDSKQPEPKPIAVVLFFNDYTPEDGFYYFRQSALSLYNGSKLIEDTTGTADKDIAKFFPTQENNNVLTPEPFNQNATKLVKTKVCLMAPHVLPWGLTAPVEFYQMGNPDPSQFVRAYGVNSQSFTGNIASLIREPVGNPNWDKKTLEHYLEIPKDPRYKKLALENTKNIQDGFKDKPMAKALMLKLWLESEGTYDNTVQVSDSDDVVAKFLFGNKTGYCVHFAHSMAYLCRSIGIPARVATGYAADARSRYDGSALLLQTSNAHAWCEVYVEGYGWTAIDVAPQKSNCCQPPPPDPDLQKMLGKIARNESGNEEGKPEETRDLQKDSREVMQFLGATLMWLLVLVILSGYGVKIYRRITPYFGDTEKRIDAVYRASLDCLADVGSTRQYGEAREDYSARESQRFMALTFLTKVHMRKSLGQHKLPTKTNTTELMEQYSQLKGQIRASIPWWRRMCGLINPISWLFVR